MYKSRFIAGGRWSTRWSSRFTNTTEAARGSPASGKYTKGVLVATGMFGIVAAGVCHLQQAEMATRVRKMEEKEEGDIAERCRNFMSPPVTDVRVLERRKQEMSTRMEMLIMETQAEFCRALQEVDGGTFQVDRWSREEGDDGLCLIWGFSVAEGLRTCCTLVQTLASREWEKKSLNDCCMK